MSSRSNVPGPFWAKMMDLWMARFDLKGKRTAMIHSLHQQYGPAVQIGPTTFCFASPRAVRDIYNHKPRLDRPRGDAMSLEQFGRENLVSTRCGDLHFRRRRAVAAGYSVPVVGGTAVQEMLRELVARFMSNLETERTAAGRRGVDVWPQLRWLAADIMSRISFGDAGGLDLLGDKEGQRESMSYYLSSSQIEEEASSLRVLMMAWFPRMSKVLEGMFPSWFITMTDTQRWALEATPKALKLDVESSDGEHIPVAMQLARHQKANGSSEAVPDEKCIAGEALDHWLAGSSTTPDALSWLLYELSRPENALRQQRLQQELRAASITPESPPHIHDLTKLTYLDCVLRETLRRHPPTPFSLTREAPSGGMTVDGHFVPGGVSGLASKMIMVHQLDRHVGTSLGTVSQPPHGSRRVP